MVHAAALPRRRVDHVVFMGMGEPMQNLANVLPALRTATSRQGLGLGARRVTVSTIGIAAGMRRLAAEAPEVNLAVSLHAPDDETRWNLVPSMAGVRVGRIVGAARAHFSETGRRVSFEYVLIRGMNDSEEQAGRLAQLLRGLPAFVNLIPLNRVPGTRLEPPTPAAVKKFLAALRRGRIPAAVRRRRGTDIDAACGQLALKTRR
jgi:23S rRNA (adenine2503-C2)-methyltransferase